ncbi:MAG: ribonuclease J [Pseudomonadota bacterium]
MSFNIKKHQDDFLFIPLGGSNEIGINVNLYHYKGKWLMVDCGGGFADDYLPGVDMLVADISFIEKYKKDLVGLVLTHAHEDHVGAVQYLWSDIECPIYATTFTANFLKTRLAEYSFAKKIKINEVKPNSSLELGPFKIEMLNLTHSAPEMQALVIKTEKGNVLHTGDWKFDDHPLVGPPSDYNLLKKYGDEGILALVCDSTNVFNRGTSGSEGDLKPSLTKIIAGCKKMVVATTFASNLARLDTLIRVAESVGRKVVLAGRSMHRMTATAQASGYLQDIPNFVDERDVSRHPRETLMILATGCQGEPMAATSKMVSGTHQSIRLAPEDTVIFSSKIIPGNDKKIYRMFNSLVKLGVEVITERDHFVHVSGHPNIDELKKMYDLVRPEICIPVHGEPVHIHEHAKIARAHGIKHAVEVENGSVVILDRENPRVIDKVETGYLAIEGNYLLPIESPIFKTRRRIRDAGVAVVTLVLKADGKLAAKPVLALPGCLDPETDKDLFAAVVGELHEAIGNALNSKHAKNPDIEDIAKSCIRRILKTEIGKSPLVIVNTVTTK